jgi:hypothetical protein
METIIFFAVWFGGVIISRQFFPIPQGPVMSVVTTVGTLVFAFWVANNYSITKVDNSDSESNSYPFDWDNIREAVLSRDSHKCGNCGSSDRLHVHHIVPLSKGGSNEIGNLRTLCEGCHKKIHPHMV